MHITSLRLEKSVIDRRALFPLEFNNLSFWITSNKYGHNTHRPIKFTSGGPGHTQTDAVVLLALFNLLHYLYAKDLRHWLFSSRDIDEQRTMWFIGRGHILVYNLKLCLLNWWKKTLLYVVITILSFWMIFYLRMRPTFGTGWVCLDIPSQKNQRNWCVTSKNIGDQRICNVRAFWPIACEPEFCQTFTFRKKKVKKLHFGPFLFI